MIKPKWAKRIVIALKTLDKINKPTPKTRKPSKKISLTKEEKKLIAAKKASDRKLSNELVEDWIREMANIGLYNQLEKTFALKNIVVEDYGFACEIHVADGLSFRDLESEKVVGIIEDNLGCKFILTRVPKSKYCKAIFITNDIPDINFKPIKLSPFELYMSTGLDGKPMVANMLKYPHVLVQGATNMGKSKFLDLMMVNLITTESPNDVAFYIAQSDKIDQIIYQRCKHTVCYARTLREIYALTIYLIKIVEFRMKSMEIHKERGRCDNIFDWNDGIKKGFIHDMPWKYSYFVIDEYANIMPDGESNNEAKIIKQAIQSNMERLIAIGRFVGLFILTGTQRATIDKMPSFVKAMSNTIVSFKVNNRKSSEIAIDTDDAVFLRQRDFIAKTDDMYYGRTVNLYPKMVDDYLEPHRYSVYKAFDLSAYDDSESLVNSKSGKKDKRKTKQERRETKDNATKNTENIQKTVEKTELSDKIVEKIQKNTQKTNKINELPKETNKISEFYIENYNSQPRQLDGVTIIDDRFINTKKSEKPKKEKKENK